jgi:hypothetical protein
VEYNTSYFDTDEISGDVVWHFDVPALGNEETFNYANFIITRNKYKYYSCVIRLHSIPIGRGQLLISKSSRKSFRIAVSLNAFGVDFEEVSLNEAPYEDETIGGEEHTEATVLQHAADVNSGDKEADYRFPMVYAYEFYGSDTSSDDVAGEYPEYNEDYERYINQWSDGSFVSNTDGNVNTLVPFPMLVPAIQKLLSSQNYSLSGSLIDTDFLTKLLVFNNVTLDNFVSDYKVKATAYSDNDKIASWYFGTSYETIPFDNVTQDDDDCFLDNIYLCRAAGTYSVFLQIDLPDFLSNIDINTYVEESGKVGIFKNDELIYVKEYNNPRSSSRRPTVYVVAYFDLVEDDTLTVKILTTNDSGIGWLVLDSTYLAIKNMIETAGKNVYNNTLNLADHLPDIYITSVINNLRNAFFMAVFFDDENSVVNTEFLQDILDNTNYVDVSSYVIEDEIETEPQDAQNMYLEWNHQEDLNDVDESNLISNYKYYSELINQYTKSYAALDGSKSVYIYDYEDDDATERTWQFYMQNFQPYGDDDDPTYEPSFDICPMPTQEVDNKVFPYTTSEAVSEVISDSDSDVGFQILQWHGVLDVPYASPLCTREDDEILSTTTNIDFNGTNGIVNKYGHDWLSFIAACEEFSVMLTSIDIWKFLEIQKLFLPKTSVNHPRWVLVNNVKALPKQFNAVINLRGDIKESELVLVKKSE